MRSRCLVSSRSLPSVSVRVCRRVVGREVTMIRLPSGSCGYVRWNRQWNRPALRTSAEASSSTSDTGDVVVVGCAVVEAGRIQQLHSHSRQCRAASHAHRRPRAPAADVRSASTDTSRRSSRQPSSRSDQSPPSSCRYGGSAPRRVTTIADAAWPASTALARSSTDTSSRP